MNLKHFSLRWQFISIFGIFTMISCLVLTNRSIIFLRKTGSELANITGQSAIREAIKVIDTDKYKDLLNSMSDEHPYYDELRLKFQEIKENTGCLYIYTMQPNNLTDAVYIVDGSEDLNSDDFSALGEIEDISYFGELALKACNGNEIIHGGVELDEKYGYMVSSYWGIKDKNGKSLGFLGVDIDMTEFETTMRSNTYTMSTIGFLFMIIGVLLVSFVASIIFGKVKKITRAMENLSQGDADLTFRIHENGGKELYKLSNSCNKVIEKMDSLVKSLQEESSILEESGKEVHVQMTGHVSQITNAVASVQNISVKISEQSKQIEAINKEISNVENEIQSLDAQLINQSSAIQDSSAAVDEISTQIVVMNKNIEKVVNEYSSLVNESNEGRKLQDTVSEQIEAIAEQSQDLTAANEAIAAIAEQTNLLAMNAAIEAAHAGEAGKGFSVVADEIRKLSETSSDQSNQIKQLLENISKAITGIVQSSVKSSQSFDNVGSKINELNNLIIQVKDGMSEQTVGMDNILNTMHTLSETTYDITKASESMKNASSNVVLNSEELKNIADETMNESNSVSEEMIIIARKTEEALTVTERNLEATRKVSDMINGFKV
ncbi:MAG: hypothetical protein HUK25_01105 [Treponema sp.]|nr:hypothetical protein [Treponema sp.]